MTGRDTATVRETEVDGVPTIVAPAPGPMRAGLMFRVGRADESLARTGVTHLVEHLALHGHGLTDYHYNGETGPVVTHFHMHGPQEAVVAFLSGVCASLRDLPLARLDTEQAILRTEAAGRSPNVNELLPLWRYGARTFGLLSYGEWGVPMLTADDVRAWAETWFTRDNAVLWVAGDDIPPGLRLDLPAGTRRPVPVPTSSLPRTPAYFVGPPGGVVLDAIVGRRVAASVFSGVLERELFRALRQDGGFSYIATTAYDPRGDGYATVTAVADALPEKQDAVLGGFIDVLKRMEVGRLDQGEVDKVVAKQIEMLDHPEAPAGVLPSHAFNLLTGFPNKSLAELREALQAVTAAEVQSVAAEVMATALLQVPEGHTADWAGFVAAPATSEQTVEGSRYPALGDADNALVVGPSGVSHTGPAGVLTVRYDACAALQAWADGGRQLIGDDAIVVRIEPTLYRVPPDVLAGIDAAVPDERVLHRPARDPADIPQPPTTRRPAAAARPSRLSTALLTVLAVVAIGVNCFGLLAIVSVATADDATGDDWLGVGIICFLGLMIALPTWLLYRQRRRAVAH